MITSRYMTAVGPNAEALGVPRKQLVESNGSAVTRACRDLADSGASVAVVADRSSNGDGTLVAVRLLKAYDVTVYLLGRPETISTDIAHGNWGALVADGADRQTVIDSIAADFGDSDLVVGAMLGTGVTGTLREPEATATRTINESSAAALTVDVPSDVDADASNAAGLAVDTDRIVTFHDNKPGLGDLDCKVVIANVDIPEAAELFTGPSDLLVLDRNTQSHKSDHGDMLVVGGGPYTGTSAPAARSVLRAGADLARIACPEGVAREMQGYSKSLIVRGFSSDRLAPEHVPDLLDFTANRDVVAFGPDLSDADESLDVVREFLVAYGGTAVTDADALQAVPEVGTETTLICTPHQGELRKMGGETSADREMRSDLVREFAANLGHTPFVKNAHDVVSGGDAVRVNRTRNPGIAVGSTGDVLAGATGALAAVLPPLDAVVVAAYASDRTGNLAADEFGGGLVATDLLERLPVGLRGDSK